MDRYIGIVKCLVYFILMSKEGYTILEHGSSVVSVHRCFGDIPNVSISGTLPSKSEI